MASKPATSEFRAEERASALQCCVDLCQYTFPVDKDAASEQFATVVLAAAWVDRGDAPLLRETLIGVAGTLL